MGSLLYNLFSCETTRYIAEYIDTRLKGSSVLYKRSTRHFCDVDFSRFQKFVCEDATSLKIKIDAILFCQVHMPNIRIAVDVFTERGLKEVMVDELNDLLQGTINSIYNEVKRICETAMSFHGAINKQIIITPNVDITTDGQFI